MHLTDLATRPQDPALNRQARTRESTQTESLQPPARADRRSSATVHHSRVQMHVNGVSRSFELDNRTTLLDALREHLQLCGTKKGCDHGQCGACTALVDGRRINTCLTLAVMHEDSEVVTIEGLGTPDHMHPLQQAFVRHDGFQCGYCTPGQICSAVGAMRELREGVPSHATTDLQAQPLRSLDEMRERMSGNLCRCGAYSNIQQAIAEAAEAFEAQGATP